MERLNIDLKGPLPSDTQNKYFHTIIDEYTRFPFVVSCPNISSQTVITCLNQLFSYVDVNQQFVLKNIYQHALLLQ